MKLLIEILLSVFLHPIAMILMWINLIARGDMSTFVKVVGSWSASFGASDRSFTCWLPTAPLVTASVARLVRAAPGQAVRRPQISGGRVRIVSFSPDRSKRR